MHVTSEDKRTLAIELKPSLELTKDVLQRPPKTRVLVSSSRHALSVYCAILSVTFFFRSFFSVYCTYDAASIHTCLTGTRYMDGRAFHHYQPKA